MGPNGEGETAVLKLILGALAPDSGWVRIGTNVVPVYFDQMGRWEELEEKTTAGV